jgi:Dopey, N-terminal
MSPSPASSGRASPVRRSREKDEGTVRNMTPNIYKPVLTSMVLIEFYKKDKNYRRYASGVERALSSFDTALQEWADYISFLGRLLKVPEAVTPEFR